MGGIILDQMKVSAQTKDTLHIAMETVFSIASTASPLQPCGCLCSTTE